MAASSLLSGSQGVAFNAVRWLFAPALSPPEALLLLLTREETNHNKDHAYPTRKCSHLALVDSPPRAVTDTFWRLTRRT